jgi:hypothetical protein
MFYTLRKLFYTLLSYLNPSSEEQKMKGSSGPTERPPRPPKDEEELRPKNE